MNDTAQKTTLHPSNFQPQGSIGATKETEPVAETLGETPQITEIGREMELPPDVTAAGVSVQPTVIHIPSHLEVHGVLPAGQNITLGTGENFESPLTNDQIVVGLKQPPTSSWRFLALLCKRRFQQIAHAIRTIGGKAVEVNT